MNCLRLVANLRSFGFGKDFKKVLFIVLEYFRKSDKSYTLSGLSQLRNFCSQNYDVNQI